MGNKKDTVLIVPTIREGSFKDLVERWDAIGLFDRVDTIIMEDNPKRTFNVPLKFANDFLHLSWENIDEELGDQAWIIPRRSDTVRSFAYYKAYQLGYDYIMTLDDDCYPTQKDEGLHYDGAGFVEEHIRNLSGRTKWFNTLSDVIPRGYPYFNRGEQPVWVNHGLWTNVLDYDAPHQLVSPEKERFAFDSRIVPRGMYFPMCGMNVMWRREATVLMYHLLMGQEMKMGKLEKLPFDRFGDIFCGIFMKKIADHLGKGVTTGMPYVRHERASNPFTNLRKEANGIEVNEKLWEYVDSVELPEKGGAAFLYSHLGNEIQKFGGEHEHYFKRLGVAMQLWAELFV